jgi:hypothetical protein
MYQQQSPQLPRQWHSGEIDTAWLSMLVDCFEKISQTDLRAVPCDLSILLALKARLAQPASLRAGRGLDFRHIN